MRIKGYDVKAVKKQYYDGSLALVLICKEDGQTYAKASVNLDSEKHKLKKDEVIIKTYSENEGILDVLLKHKIVKKTGRSVSLLTLGGEIQLPVIKVLI